MKQLVQSGGEFENAHIFIQGDRDGTHENAMLQTFINDYCHQEVWKWYPQAPQMPYAHVLDLSVFPAMIQRHYNLIRTKNGLRVASNNEICNCAKEVWDTIPNEKIGHAFVQY